MGQAWNYKWMCGAAQATENVGKACDATWTFTQGNTITIPTPTQTSANTTPLVSVVSLWSLGNAGTLNTGNGKWNTKSDFKITFAAGAWSDGFSGLTALAAPTAPVAAKSLTGLAGAQALAASTAAALAAAAALY